MQVGTNVEFKMFFDRSEYIQAFTLVKVMEV